MTSRIQIPTINDEPADFETLFGLWSEIEDEEREWVLDFTHCRFLKQNAVAFLGGLIRCAESRGGTISIDESTLPSAIGMNLKQNGFLPHFTNNGSKWRGNSVPFREDRDQDHNSICHYLKQNWLGRSWVQASQPLQNAIVGAVWELYANAFEHSQSEIGIFTCGQHYPQLEWLSLTIVDFGVGIPANVRRYSNDMHMLASDPLEWALKSGTTTREKGVCGGMGLDVLKAFIKKNQGKLEIYSCEGYALINQSVEEYKQSRVSFEGTLANISLRCNEAYYQLASECDDALLF
ncbi:MAG: sensor histidine kinase [Synechococcaceae cyanobacterium SM2_3_2]|nr:sensor histidine kinase [Synechococcaceae cyanobacterium SM2_3_2]